MLAFWSHEGAVFLDFLPSPHLVTSFLFLCLGSTNALCPHFEDPVPLPPKWRPYSQGPRTLPYRDPEHPCCMSMLHVHAGYSCCMSVLHVHADADERTAVDSFDESNEDDKRVCLGFLVCIPLRWLYWWIFTESGEKTRKSVNILHFLRGSTGKNTFRVTSNKYLV